MTSTFDPTLFDLKFEYDMSTDDYKFWSSMPQENDLIGSYALRYDVQDDWWSLQEIISINGTEREISIYSGRIPDNRFGFDLFKNMDLTLPVIQRESKIDFLTN